MIICFLLHEQLERTPKSRNFSNVRSHAENKDICIKLWLIFILLSSGILQRYRLSLSNFIIFFISIENVKNIVCILRSSMQDCKTTKSTPFSDIALVPQNIALWFIETDNHNTIEKELWKLSYIMWEK